MAHAFYEKTAAGQQEISSRSANLSFRERQLLIVIDGQMSVEALSKLMPLADLLLRLEKLEAAGLITQHDAPVIQDLTANQPLPNPAALAEIRSILQQGNMLYLGGDFTTTLQSDFDQAKTRQELEQLIAKWYEELLNQGKMRYAEQQLTQIRLLLASKP
ncbi:MULTISPECIES: hypothetical protein [Deefgea]|uniref:MarR family transcriptional regulator n=1 Tax=Deefgea chitinilytica TaxID=570276 RepID=A0ABS2CFL2_9NEIS|nr:MULTISPECIES: hypothetical protein [Deefgea]MBM5572455.1 hypothetical protein [Deefgea chitinilytica]MBM9889691.1 hypothetical protein [Deefgea sp. CFH1-16]